MKDIIKILETSIKELKEEQKNDETQLEFEEYVRSKLEQMEADITLIKKSIVG
jgi:hypothetical protein